MSFYKVDKKNNICNYEHCDKEDCLHLHILCMNCDMKDGYCHCLDGGDWFCQDCNKMEYELNDETKVFITIKEAVEVRRDSESYQHQDHSRRFFESKTKEGGQN